MIASINSSFLMTECYSIIDTIDHTLFMPSSVDGHSGGSHFLAVMFNASRNVHCKLCGDIFFISPRYVPWSRTSGS